MNVLSLFDGMSCGQQALERAGILVEKYFASEVDKYAIQITKKNYPNTIHLGDVRMVDANQLGKIDLLIGGSPCQSFSFAGKRKGMATKNNIEILTLEHYIELKSQNFEFEGQSYLFWEYMRLLKEVRPKYFLLENVLMGQRWERVLSRAIGCNPIEINSALVSAQNRRRLYWTNIGAVSSGLFGLPTSTITQPKDLGVLLKDVLQPTEEIDEKYFLSEKMIAGFQKHAIRHKEKGTGFAWNPTEGNKKGNCLRANGALCATDNIIVHNTMPRSSTTGKGGSGPLSCTDGKTYCLDTGGSTNAVEYSNKRLNETIEKYRENLVDGTLIDSYNKSIHNEKSITISTRVNASNQTHLYINRKIRRLTPVECERLQTVADNYTHGVSDSQRYKMLGNGWTVDVIAHIFKYII
jgi:site-specific DNA-cytosine methylase